MKAEKVKRNAEDFLQWAGFFSQEPEIVARQPGWWQRERKFIREQVQAGRSFTIEDMLAVHQVNQTRVQQHIPSTMSLQALRSRYKTSSTPGQVLAQLQAIVTQDEVIRLCTAFGEGRQLLRWQPPHGLYGYLWRLAIHQRKIVPSIPLTAFYELEEGIYGLTGDWLSTEQRGEAFDGWVNSLVTFLLSSVA